MRGPASAGGGSPQAFLSAGLSVGQEGKWQVLKAVSINQQKSGQTFYYPKRLTIRCWPHDGKQNCPGLSSILLFGMVFYLLVFLAPPAKGAGFVAGH